MNNDENFQKKMDAVWEKFLVTLANEKMRKVELLDSRGNLSASSK